MKSLVCVNRGELYTDLQKRSLGLGSLDYAPCNHKDKPHGQNVCTCNMDTCGPNCRGYAASTAFDPITTECDGQLRRIKINGSKLSKAPADAHFNSSIIRYNDRLLMAYRTGWADADCHIAVLNEMYQPLKTVCLKQLRHPKAASGREDPRLFIFRGRLHVSYIGYANGMTSQLYARLTDDYRVEEVFYPHFNQRKTWEKNWGFFEWSGELFALYSGSPHCIMHVVGNAAYPFVESENTLPWSGGHVRGGAPPIRVGGYYYHWFHGYIELTGKLDRRYSIGINKFEADIPFKTVNQTANPIIWADDTTVPFDCGRSVVFPCGAILENGIWKVSMGVHDRWTEIIEYDQEWVERAIHNTR